MSHHSYVFSCNDIIRRHTEQQEEKIQRQFVLHIYALFAMFESLMMMTMTMMMTMMQTNDNDDDDVDDANYGDGRR